MSEYKERHYRRRVRSSDLAPFHVAIKETDLWISAEQPLEEEAKALVFNHRRQLENYISAHPDFLTTLQPYPEDPYAPPIVKEMISFTRGLGVGPMASVAGAIAQHVALGLLRRTNQVIVENGGDIFLKVNRPVTVSIFAGDSPLSEKIGLAIPARIMPVGVCSSSATVGHSLSMGAADVACIISYSAVLADGAATALCNKVRSKKDLKRLGSWAQQTDGIRGALVILGGQMATWGEIELVGL
ncbi:MAG: UPF0280 family protein [Desulfobacteraceae bacterium]|jgi:ApbE superfamily uncharacterized protein (UPF0280 family)